MKGEIVGLDDFYDFFCSFNRLWFILYEFRRNYLKNFLINDKIIGIGSFFIFFCKVVDENEIMKRFIDIKFREMLELCVKEIFKGSNVDLNLISWRLMEWYEFYIFGFFKFSYIEYCKKLRMFSLKKRELRGYKLFLNIWKMVR